MLMAFVRDVSTVAERLKGDKHSMDSKLFVTRHMLGRIGDQLEFLHTREGVKVDLCGNKGTVGNELLQEVDAMSNNHGAKRKKGRGDRGAAARARVPSKTSAKAQVPEQRCSLQD